MIHIKTETKEETVHNERLSKAIENHAFAGFTEEVKTRELENSSVMLMVSDELLNKSENKINIKLGIANEYTEAYTESLRIKEMFDESKKVIITRREKK